MTDSEILRYAIWGVEGMIAKSKNLKKRMDNNGISDKHIDNLIKSYQNKLDKLNNMLIIATDVGAFYAMSKDN